MFGGMNNALPVANIVSQVMSSNKWSGTFLRTGEIEERLGVIVSLLPKHYKIIPGG
jgi:hypothetical protein